MCIAIAPNKSFINIPLVNVKLISEIKDNMLYMKNFSVDRQLLLSSYLKIIASKIN